MSLILQNDLDLLRPVTNVRMPIKESLIDSHQPNLLLKAMEARIMKGRSKSKWILWS